MKQFQFQQFFLKYLFPIFLITLISALKPSHACTDFRIKAQDASVIITRSMEFTEDFNSNVRTRPRGSDFDIITPDDIKPNGTVGMSWKNKYGYVYVDGLERPIAIDGMNEKGLSFGFLYLPGETQYQTIPKNSKAQALPYYLFGDWILGNFATIDEVKSALPNIIIFEQKIKGLGDTVFPLHVSIYEPSGKGLVIEFIKGEMKIYDNDVGVLTNSPTYDWQTTNLRNYVNLSPYNPSPVKAYGLTFIATGQGAGMLGLPGDVSPPSRFVKTASLSTTASKVENSQEALNLAQHIINNVDIPSGLVRAKNEGKDLTETTQWVVFKDLSQKKFYYRTYNDMTIRSINLNELNFSENAPQLKIRMKAEPFVKDITKEFMNSKDTMKQDTKLSENKR